MTRRYQRCTCCSTSIHRSSSCRARIWPAICSASCSQLCVPKSAGPPLRGLAATEGNTFSCSQRAPGAAAACAWREALGPVPLKRLRDRLLAGVDGEHRARDWRAVTAGDLEVGSIDGTLIRVPDTPASREAFGSAGTADDSSPNPQLRDLRISHAFTSATFGVVTGPAGAAVGGSRDKGEAEQVAAGQGTEGPLAGVHPLAVVAHGSHRDQRLRGS
jgi:hypothetical protein